MTDQIETQGTAQVADQIAVLCDILDMDSTGITPDTSLRLCLGIAHDFL